MKYVVEHHDGFDILSTEGMKREVTPLACPVCDRLMRSSDDVAAYRISMCCDACSEAWARPRRKEWQDGWRPPQEDVDAHVALRPMIFVKIPES